MNQTTAAENEMSPKNKKVTRIAWENSVWFTDVDDTLIDTMSAAEFGADGIRQALVSHFGEANASEIQANFSAMFQLMFDGYRVKQDDDWRKIEGGKEAFDALLDSVASRQAQVKKEYGHIKKWSREIFIKLAADKAGVEITLEQVHEAADAYWMNLTEHIEIFPDAFDLAVTVADHGRPLYLVTSSDARLKMQPDGQFIYDPSYSEALKRQRIELLRARGLKFNTISIGDPEDKPHPDFFAKAISMAERDLGYVIDNSNAIMLGDSFGGDLQTPKEQLGFGLVVLREGNLHEVQVVDPHQIAVGSLAESVKYLD